MLQKKQSRNRRMVIIAVMTALSVTGRLIPFFKPVTALTTITAMSFGPGAGFLVGAMSAVLSNFAFGQGPWTPYQMAAWGLIGVLAGVLAKYLKKSKLHLILFAVLSAVAFSMIMDIWTVVWYNRSFDFNLFLAAMVTAIPHTILYAVSNAFFLWALAKPMGEKLDRIRVKYGV